MPRLDIVAQQNHLYPYSDISFGGSLIVVTMVQMDLETIQHVL